MLGSVLLWGTIIGIIHFVAIGVLYSNPLVDRMYQRAMASDPAVRRWDSRGRYLVLQFLGSQVEIFLLTVAFFWLRPLLGVDGYMGAAFLGLLLAGVRIYSRFWTMWIQSNYPRNMLAIECVNGTIGTLLVMLGLQALT